MTKPTTYRIYPVNPDFPEERFDILPEKTWPEFLIETVAQRIQSTFETDFGPAISIAYQVADRLAREALADIAAYAPTADDVARIEAVEECQCGRPTDGRIGETGHPMCPSCKAAQ